MYARSLLFCFRRGLLNRWAVGALLLSQLAMSVEAAAIKNLIPLTRLAGRDSIADKTDGRFGVNRLRAPHGVAVAPNGIIYISDTENCTIRVLQPNGDVSTLAGSAGDIGLADGIGASARFRDPEGIVVAPNGLIFVCDHYNGKIRQVSPSGTVTTLPDPTGRLKFPAGLAVDASGALYVADDGNHTIVKVTPGGEMITLAGSPNLSGSSDGAGSNARFREPRGIAVDSAGVVYVADSVNQTVRKVTPDGVVTTLAGTAGSSADYVDGLGAAARFFELTGIAVASDGNLYATDYGNNAIRRITPTGMVTTVADQTATYRPFGVAVDGNGKIYVANAGGCTIYGPSNDNFADRLTLTGDNASNGRTNAGASAEPGEPDHYWNTAAHSMWWKWTAPDFGRLTVSTVGSTFDTVLGIYTGTSVGSLRFIGGDDEFGGNSTSLTSIFVVPGETYSIAVDGYKGVVGDIALQLKFAPTSEIYFTDFESVPTASPYLLGFDGWLATSYQDSTAVVAPDLTNSLAGRLGLNPTAESGVLAYRPINFDPVGAGASVVKFTTDMAIVDSTNGQRDSFHFLLYDIAGSVRAGIKFNNADLQVSRFDGTAFNPAGTFVRGVRAKLSVIFDFRSNQWSATLNGAVLFSNQPIDVSNRPLTLGDIDPFWEVATKGSSGNNYLTFDNFRIMLDGSPPVIVSGPMSLSVKEGNSVYWTVNATGDNLTYQWYKDGAAIGSAQSPSYTIANMAPGYVGTYTVAVTSSGRTVRTAPAVLTQAYTADVGRLVNLSVRTHAGTGATALFMGVVIGGRDTAGQKPALIRVAGPTLGTFGVSEVLPDPKLEIVNQSTGTVFATNDDWGGDAMVSNIGRAVGAFPFMAAASKDSALYSSLGTGPYAVKVLGRVDANDIALAEIYDATPAGSYVYQTPRLVNVSARAQVETGGGILIAGFVVGGSSARTVMIRGIGPTLGSYGVGGALSDPTLLLYQQVNGANVLIAANNDWSDTPNANLVSAVSTQVGAFALSSGTRDAVLLMTLPPGVYSAQLSGVNGTTGVGLVEVYEVP